MSRGQVKNITGDSFFAWTENLALLTALASPQRASNAIISLQ
jgi:hypothetical protein